MCSERIGAILLRIAELIRTKRLKLNRMTRKQGLVDARSRRSFV
jgi:hypothetical protein